MFERDGDDELATLRDEYVGLMNRRGFVGIAGAAIAALATPGLAFSQRSARTSSAAASQLVFAVSGGPAALDPGITIAGTDWVSLANIYDGLFMRDYASDALPARTIPGLATDYKVSADGRTYTFSLRKGVEFHDGTPWDADAAVFNFRRWFDKAFKYYYPRANATVNGFIGGVASYHAPNKNTFVVTLTKPNAGWFDYLTAAPTFFMISPTSIMKYGNAGIATHGIGTGPFIVTEYTQNVRLVLASNPKFWGGAPRVPQLVIVPVTDDAARLSGLLSGQYDIAHELPPNTIQQIQSNSQFKVEYAQKPVTFGFAGDTRSGPWGDPLVRQAVSLAIDRRGIAEKVLYNAGTPATQFYAPGNPAYDKSLPIQDPYDPTLAKSILGKSQYGKGLHFKFYTSTSAMGVPNPSQILEVVQSNLNAIGISSEIGVSEWTAYLGFWAKGTPSATGNVVPIYTQAMGWDTNMLIGAYCAGSSWPPNGVNYAWYKNPTVDSFFAKAGSSKSVAQLISNLRAGQKAMLKDRPYIYIFHGKSVLGLKQIVNWKPANTWAQRLSKATIA